MTYEIIEGDCLDVMPTLAAQSVDLVVTSPPYAKQRKTTYGGVSADEYVGWFLPIAGEIQRVLKPTGSFVLNIKEHCENGERHTYVLDLIHALRGQGWLWTEEYIWHKSATTPGKWPNRFRDAWERCLHFTRARGFSMYQESVMAPTKESSIKRANARRQNDDRRISATTGSGFGVNVSHFIGREMSYPTNVLYLSPESSSQGHPAPYPVELPDWFIRLFMQTGDTVLDPFAGSGTTGVACLNTGRHFIGIEREANYCAIGRSRLQAAAAQPRLELTA